MAEFSSLLPPAIEAADFFDAKWYSVALQVDAG